MFNEANLDLEELCRGSMTLEEVGDVIAKTSSEDVKAAAKRKFHRMEKQYLRELSQKKMTWQRAEEIRCMAERAKDNRCVRELELERRAEQRRDWLRLDEMITEEEVEEILSRAYFGSKLGIKAQKMWNRLHAALVRRPDQEITIRAQNTIAKAPEDPELDQNTTMASRMADGSHICSVISFVAKSPCSARYLRDHEYF